MKKLHLIVLILAVSTASYGQKFGKLTQVKGYYKDLQAYSPEPRSPDEKIDKQKFPYDAASAERRLNIKPYYLTNARLEDFQIPDPPANSSEQTRAELNYLLQLQQKRTSLDVDASMYMAGIFYSVKTSPEDSSYSFYRNNLFHIGRSLGSWFNPEDLPLTADLMAHVWQDASYFVWSAKYKYLRIRPWVIDPDIQNLENANWAAYPSGHAANSYVNAYVYQELAPEFSEVFIKDAYDMAHSREIIGVHYPSDSETSRVLARQIVNRLFQNERFLKDLEAVKKEWATKARETFERPQLIGTGDAKAAPSCGSTATTSSCTKPASTASTSPCAKTCQ